MIIQGTQSSALSFGLSGFLDKIVSFMLPLHVYGLSYSTKSVRSNFDLHVIETISTKPRVTGFALAIL